MKRISLVLVLGAFAMACGNGKKNDAGTDTGTSDDGAIIDNGDDATVDPGDDAEVPGEDAEVPIEEPVPPPDALIGSWRATGTPGNADVQAVYTEMVFYPDHTLSVRVASTNKPTASMYRGCTTTVRTDGYHWEHTMADGGDVLVLTVATDAGTLTTTAARMGCMRAQDDVAAVGGSSTPSIATGSLPFMFDAGNAAFFLALSADAGTATFVRLP